MTEMHTRSTAPAASTVMKMLLEEHIRIHVMVLRATPLIFKHLLSSIIFPP